jgi:hypothetical protein
MYVGPKHDTQVAPTWEQMSSIPVEPEVLVDAGADAVAVESEPLPSLVHESNP